MTTTSFDVTTDLTSLFGTAIALGDFNGDNDEDLAIGVPAAVVNGTRSGAVFVFLGTGSGLDRAPVTIVPDDRIDGMSFGAALHPAEFNDGSDGDELVIGAPGAVDFASGLLNELSSLLGLGDPFSF
ncbi:MAG: integrin alpha, partial [Planctomycetota bacterium]